MKHACFSTRSGRRAEQNRGAWVDSTRRARLYTAALALLLALPAGCGGCRDSDTASTGGDYDEQAASAQYREELLTYAVDNLGRLDEFGSSRIMAQISSRIQTLVKDVEEGSDRPFDPMLTGWPESEMLHQIVDRLNQWIQAQRPPAGWRLDPLVASLPAPMAELPQVKNLEEMEFSRFDGYALREAAWLRDVASWARGDTIDELQRAGSLFDWTVRNIQIEADLPGRAPLLPWETLLFGRGAAAERAWVFILLLRQANIDAAMLVIDGESGAGGAGSGQAGENGAKTNDENTKNPDASGADSLPSLPPLEPSQPAAGQSRPWCVGVLIEKNVYLFDPQLGLPIPAPDGVAMDESGRLTIRPATLAEVRADAKLLERMDVSESRAYGVRPADLSRLAVLLEASPPYLACRMSALESRLAGDQRMALTASPTAAARRWKEAAGLDGARLWLHPYQTLLVRSSFNRRQVVARLAAMLPFYAAPAAPLMRGRMLNLKGRLVGDDGAMKYYQAARPSNAELIASSIEMIEKEMLYRGKQDATYWCGLIVSHRGDYDAAIDYFKTRTLEADPNGPWTRGARYNLARAYEASGQTDRAILLYGLDAASPGYHGDLLRAKWLRELSAESKGE